MSTELAIVKNQPEFLIIPNGTTFDEWWAFREHLYNLKVRKEQAEIAVVLQTMDWIYWGEENSGFGHEKTQGTAFVEEEMGWSPATYSTYYNVWRRFGPDKRVPGLGITFYQAVMGIPEKAGWDLLTLAAENNWTREQLRKAVKQHYPEDKTPAVTRKDIEKAGIEVLRNLKPAGNHYELEEGPAQELALLLDHTLVDLVIEEKRPEKLL